MQTNRSSYLGHYSKHGPMRKFCIEHQFQKCKEHLKLCMAWLKLYIGQLMDNDSHPSNVPDTMMGHGEILGPCKMMLAIHLPDILLMK